MKLNSKQLRTLTESEAKSAVNQPQNERQLIYFIVENVYDTYNVGGLFRLADALNVAKIYLCGETEIPPNHKIVKASIGTYKIVSWEYKSSASEAIAELRQKYEKRSKKPETNFKFETLENSKLARPERGRRVSDLGFSASNLQVIAIEQAKGSIDYREAKYSLPLALIVGNETSGVTEETLKLCDQIVEIPMWGINKSLNVIVSAAVVGYWVVSASNLKH